MKDGGSMDIHDSHAVRMWLIRQGNQKLADDWLLELSRKLQAGEKVNAEELGFLGYVLFQHWNEGRSTEFWTAGKRPDVRFKTNRDLDVYFGIKEQTDLEISKPDAVAIVAEEFAEHRLHSFLPEDDPQYDEVQDEKLREKMLSWYDAGEKKFKKYLRQREDANALVDALKNITNNQSDCSE